MSKIRRIEITIETHEIIRVQKGRRETGADRTQPDKAPYPFEWPTHEATPGPDLILFSADSSVEDEVSNPTPLAVDDRSHIPGKSLNG